MVYGSSGLGPPQHCESAVPSTPTGDGCSATGVDLLGERHQTESRRSRSRRNGGFHPATLFAVVDVVDVVDVVPPRRYVIIDTHPRRAQLSGIAEGCLSTNLAVGERP